MSGGFSFNPPSSSAASGGSLFGTSGNNPGGSIFGNTGSSGGSGGGFSFGGFGQSTNTTTSGDTPSQNATAGNKPGGLFGQSSGGTGFSFGSKPAEGASNEAPKSTGFGAGAPSQSSNTANTSSGSAPSLFGSTTPANNKTNNFSFASSTTPAGPPPTTSAFGASTGGTSIFGSRPAQPQTQTQAQSSSQPTTQANTFSFGKPATTTASSTTTTAPASGGGGLFGGATSGPSGGLFGPKPSSGGNTFTFPSAQQSAPSTAQSTETARSMTATSEAPKPNLFNMGSANTTAPTTAAGPSGGLFGSAPATSQPSSNLFGSAPSTNQSPAGLFAPKSTAADTGSKPAFSFQTPGAPASATPGNSAAPASKPLFSPTTTTSSTSGLFSGAPAATTTTTSNGPSFFAPQSTATQGSSLPVTTVSSAPKTSGFSFGPTITSASTSQSSLATTTAPTPSATATAQAVSSSTTAPTTTSNFAASQAGPVPPSQSRLRNKTMDEILTRWATDLSKYTKDFKSQAETIAKWDQMIVDSSSKIDKLYVRTRTCEKQTSSVEMQLTAIENQQAELESWLSKYENDVDEMLAREGGAGTGGDDALTGPDQERERTYKLAETLDEKLDDMGKDLESMVGEINAANATLSANGKGDEPITQIVKILNSHLTQLQAIDAGTTTLQQKVVTAQKMANNYGSGLNGLGSDGAGANGNGNTAVEGFSRSYFGRR